MKLLTEKEIEEMVKNIADKNDLVCLIPVSGSGSGVSCHEHTLCDHEVIELIQKSIQEVHKLLLESASEGFEEWENKTIQDNGGSFPDFIEPEDLWQAAKLSSAKEMQEKDTEIEELKKENGNLKKLLDTTNDIRKIEFETFLNLKKENEELRKQKKTKRCVRAR